jgi:hypothetical protein
MCTKRVGVVLGKAYRLVYVFAQYVSSQLYGDAMNVK